MELYLDLAATKVSAFETEGRFLELIEIANIEVMKAARSFEPGTDKGHAEFQRYLTERINRVLRAATSSG